MSLYCNDCKSTEIGGFAGIGYICLDCESEDICDDEEIWVTAGFHPREDEFKK